MSNMSLIAIVGIAILVTATVGFGATLTTTPTFNLIGASDNNAVTTARGNITALTWTEEVGPNGQIETDQINFLIANNDLTVGPITFEVCAVIEFNNSTWGGGQYFSPSAGSAPACVNSASLAANTFDTSKSIDFALAVNVTEIVDISFSVEETAAP